MATATDLKVKPLADRVVVKPLEEEEQMRGGLYIPDTAKEKPQQGEIVAVGPGKLTDDGKRVDPELKVGDKVSWQSRGGIAHGTIARRQTSRASIKGHAVAASPEHPQFIVETAEGKKAAHKPDALKKE